MEKQCKNCGNTYKKTVTTSVKSWGKSKYCSKICKKLGESKSISERIIEQNKQKTGIMRFNGIEYSRQWCLDNPKEVEKIIEARKLVQKELRKIKSNLSKKERLAKNPKVLKTDEDKKIWQIEYRKRKKSELKAYDQKDSSKFRQYKSSALRRNYSFELSFDQFVLLFHSNCSYCNKEDCRGIDRIINSIGYTINNSTPCCEMCNKMKWRYTKQDFIDQIKRIYLNITNK